MNSNIGLSRKDVFFYFTHEESVSAYFLNG